ncbi:MAG: oligosaccharide flippase family protein [Acidimicrobiia bacterium]|nr:oligosaccharide flippase family protein [Acidimicrobiia bacterium]
MSSPITDRGLRRAIALSSAGTTAARVTGAVGGVLAARLLGPTGRGQLAILTVVGVVGATAAAAGLQFWVAREVARSGGVRVAWRVVVRHAAVIVMVVPLVGLLVGPAVGAFADAPPEAIAAAVGLAFAGALAFILLALPHGMRAMGVVATATTTAGAVYLSVTLVRCVAGVESVALVLVGAALGQLASAAVSYRFVARSLRAPGGDETQSHTHGHKGWTGYRTALGFGAPGGAGELVLLSMLRIDVLVVAAFLPLEAVGLYAVATALTEMLWVVPDGVALVVLPTTARDPLASRTRALLVPTLALTAAAGLVLTLIDAPLVRALFGASFAGATAAVPFLAVAAVAGGAWKVIGAEVVAHGRTAPRLWSASAGLVTMLAVDLVSVTRLGIEGAALGSACGYLVAALVMSRAWAMQLRQTAMPVTAQPAGRSAA